MWVYLSHLPKQVFRKSGNILYTSRGLSGERTSSRKPCKSDDFLGVPSQTQMHLFLNEAIRVCGTPKTKQQGLNLSGFLESLTSPAARSKRQRVGSARGPGTINLNMRREFRGKCLSLFPTSRGSAAQGKPGLHGPGGAD